MKTDVKNIWILGGTGFIGKALVKHFLNNPEYKLHILIHKNVPYKFLESCNTFTGNLESFDFKWMDRYPPDIIFHLARLGGSNFLTRYWASRRGFSANKRLIDYLSKLKSPPKIVYVSGSLMYGHQENGQELDEFSELNPTSYAKQYIRGEQPWIEAQKQKLLDVRFARPGWIVGAESWFKIFYWNYFIALGKVPIFSEGNQLMSVIHLDDCAGQIANLGKNGKAYQNMNLFSGQPITQLVFAETLAKILNSTTISIPVEKVHEKYGKTVTEALISSIPLKTIYPKINQKYTNQFPSIIEILENTISILKNK